MWLDNILTIILMALIITSQRNHSKQYKDMHINHVLPSLYPQNISEPVNYIVPNIVNYTDNWTIKKMIL